MVTELLVNERVDGGEDLRRQLQSDGFPISAMFWVQTTEEGSWYLCIASDLFDPSNLGEAYRAVHASLVKMSAGGVALSDLKLVNTSDPVTQAAIKIRDRHVGRIPTRYRGPRLGPLSIAEAYIYPRSDWMTVPEVLQTVSTLMGRTGSIQPSSVVLKGGNKFFAIPVGLNMNVGGRNGVVITLHDVNTGVDRQVPADEILWLA